MSSLQTTTFFRFVYDPKDFIITINIYESAYKTWNEKIMESIYDYTEVNILLFIHGINSE